MLLRDVLPPPMDDLVEAFGAGDGLAPVGRLTLLLRRSARYAARSWSVLILAIAEVEEGFRRTELIVRHVGRRWRRDLPGSGPVLRFSTSKHDVRRSLRAIGMA